MPWRSLFSFPFVRMHISRTFPARTTSSEPPQHQLTADRLHNDRSSNFHVNQNLDCSGAKDNELSRQEISQNSIKLLIYIIVGERSSFGKRRNWKIGEIHIEHFNESRNIREPHKSPPEHCRSQSNGPKPIQNFFGNFLTKHVWVYGKWKIW